MKKIIRIFIIIVLIFGSLGCASSKSSSIKIETEEGTRIIEGDNIKITDEEGIEYKPVKEDRSIIEWCINILSSIAIGLIVIIIAILLAVILIKSGLY